MAFFDEVKGKLTQAGQSTMQKTQELTEIARINGRITEAKDKINELYGQIGYEICHSYAQNPLPEVAELMAKVSELHDSIEAGKERINTIKSASLCPNCGAKIKPNMMFCSECGSKLPAREQPVKTGDAQYCSNCGAPMAAGSMFCTSCGAKIG